MKVAINASFLVPKGGGVKEYILNLIYQFSCISSEIEYIIYIPKKSSDEILQMLPNNLKIKETPFLPYQAIKRSLFENKFWKKEEKLERFDVFHSPFFHSPKLQHAKIIITIHDLRLCRYPRTYNLLRYLFLKNAVKNSIKRCDHIISISEFTKKEILTFFNVDEKKISVIHEAINPERFSSESIADSKDIPSHFHNKKFMLYVAHLEPRKNHMRLLKVFDRINNHPQLKDFFLVLVGKRAESASNIEKAISSMPNVFYVEFIEHSFLIWLYKNAELLVFPTFYEGFGFPPLEAAALNTVSAVAKVSSMPEICGESAFYFDPMNEEDMYNTLLNALLNEQSLNDKRSKLKSNLSRFCWKKNALQTIDLYKKLK